MREFYKKLCAVFNVCVSHLLDGKLGLGSSILYIIVQT